LYICLPFLTFETHILFSIFSWLFQKGISFLQLTPAEKTEIKNSGHATSGLVLDHHANTNLSEKI